MANSNLNKQDKLKVGKLITDLQSKEEVKIAGALKAFSVHGHASVIDPIIETWRNGLSKENEALVFDLFQSLKDTSAIEPLMEAFKNPTNSNLQRKLLATFWNSKLDFSDYLADFVLFGIEGDFLDALEAITVIENFEMMAPESAILESQLLLTEYFGQNQGEDQQKDAILTDLALLLKDFSEAEGTEDLFLE
ncbi:hypothetical protein [Fluviicola taffensis]|uniref:Uncharacterized protein n=1 Tax=Fluviicola taffensis (strain DSM 16823 / NCIMB 13979 / RW262) TaxID=755732 RepID=F2I9P7_FLUTR|nr:hypothetical protein [Fluviicola taffensis]AEA43043.1 hypothetical protein Fluta_1045 [Fluviicola taffensis DSM 16823]